MRVGRLFIATLNRVLASIPAFLLPKALTSSLHGKASIFHSLNVPSYQLIIHLRMMGSRSSSSYLPLCFNGEITHLTFHIYRIILPSSPLALLPSSSAAMENPGSIAGELTPESAMIHLFSTFQSSVQGLLGEILPPPSLFYSSHNDYFNVIAMNDDFNYLLRWFRDLHVKLIIKFFGQLRDLQLLVGCGMSISILLLALFKRSFILSPSTHSSTSTPPLIHYHHCMSSNTNNNVYSNINNLLPLLKNKTVQTPENQTPKINDHNKSFSGVKEGQTYKQSVQFTVGHTSSNYSPGVSPRVLVSHEESFVNQTAVKGTSILGKPPTAPTNQLPTDTPTLNYSFDDLEALCLFGKVWGAHVPLRAIIHKTRIDWAFLKGPLDFVELGNNWILIKFSNAKDRGLVWTNRPWFVNGLNFVLKLWIPFFDPYNEPIIRIDQWIRVPKVPLELWKPIYLTEIVASIGPIVRIDQNTLDGVKGKFARVCVSIDITKTLAGSLNISYKGKTMRVPLTYEGLYDACPMCGDKDHRAEHCPLTIEMNKCEFKVEKFSFLDSENVRTNSENPPIENCDDNWTKIVPKKRFRQTKSGYNLKTRFDPTAGPSGEKRHEFSPTHSFTADIPYPVSPFANKGAHFPANQAQIIPNNSINIIPNVMGNATTITIVENTSLDITVGIGNDCPAFGATNLHGLNSFITMADSDEESDLMGQFLIEDEEMELSNESNRKRKMETGDEQSSKNVTHSSD